MRDSNIQLKRDSQRNLKLTKFNNIGLMQDWMRSFGSPCPFEEAEPSSASLLGTQSVSALCKEDVAAAQTSGGSDINDRNNKATTWVRFNGIIRTHED